MIGKFKKKPDVINAVKWTGDNIDEVEGLLKLSEYSEAGYIEGDYVRIGTSKGLMSASLNDWIIKSDKGECYPVTEEIFLETYENAD